MCGAQVPPAGPGRYNNRAEVSPVELDLYRGGVLNFSHHARPPDEIRNILPEWMFLFLCRIMPRFPLCTSL